MITRTSMLDQVRETIAGSPDSHTIDVDAVVDDIWTDRGLVDVNTIGSDEYWAIVARHDSTQT